MSEKKHFPPGKLKQDKSDPSVNLMTLLPASSSPDVSGVVLLPSAVISHLGTTSVKPQT